MPFGAQYYNAGGPIAGDLVQLDVPYLYQLDSEVMGGRHAGRSCFSSTNAMLAEHLRPGTLKGTQADDAYLLKVFEYGDTTSAEARTVRHPAVQHAISRP